MGAGVLLLVLFMWIGWVLMQSLQAEFLPKASPEYVVVLGGGVEGVVVPFSCQSLKTLVAAALAATFFQTRQMGTNDLVISYSTPS